MSTWDTAAARYRESSVESDLFIKLADDGKKFVGAFLGEPQIREVVWNQVKGTYEEFTEEHRDEGLRPSPRYRMNVYLPNEKALKIWEVNNQTFEKVLKVREKYGLDKWFFEVQRSGTKGDTKTSYTVLPETKIDEASQASIAKLTLHDLGGGSAKTTTASAPPPRQEAMPLHTPGHARADIPTIDTNTAQALIGRLKALPQARVSAFMTFFEIGQVRSLPSAFLPAALRTIEEYERAERRTVAPPVPEATAAIDPFGIDDDADAF